MASKSEVLRRAPDCVRLVIHPGARASRPHPNPANSLPSKATPLQSAPNPPLRGALPSCQALCGRDARAPGGSFFTRGNASTASMAKRGADGRNDHQIDLLAGGRIRARWRSRHVTGWRRSPKCCGGLLIVFGGQSTRERGRPARTLFLQTACHPRPLRCKAHRTRLYGVLFHRAGVCAGETPALPGGVYSFPPPDPWRVPLEHPPTP